MLENISTEIMYCRARARLAREKGDTVTSVEVKNDFLAAEARWLVLMRCYELQDRLSKSLSEHESSKAPRRGARKRECALDPEVVAILSSAFQAVFIFALWVGRRIIELTARGERDPDRFKANIRAWAAR
jgi:hypothetical protein